jgi:hypothetical protein
MLQYWLAVFIKGFRDSFNFVKQDRQGIAFAILVLLLTILWLVKKHGWTDAMKHWWRTAGEGLVIAIVAWVLILIVHLIWEPYHIQEDMAKNRSQLQKVYDQQGSEFTICRANFQTEQAKTQLLSDRVTSQQAIINSQQGTFNAQQNTFNAQQATLSAQQTTMNSCMATLGDLEKPQPLKITPFPLGVVEGRKNPTVARYSTDFVLLTNKIITPVRLVVTCEPGLVQAGGGVLGTAGSMGGGWNILPSPKSYGIGFSSPAWTPDSPMLVTIFSNEKITGCSFSEQ